MFTHSLPQQKYYTHYHIYFTDEQQQQQKPSVGYVRFKLPFYIRQKREREKHLSQQTVENS